MELSVKWKRIVDWVADMGVGRQMNCLLLIGAFAPPLTILVLMETALPETVRAVIVLYMAAWVLLYTPVSKGIAHVVALRNIDRCNGFCRSLQDGRGTAELHLPPERGSDNDFIRLKRNMFWMGRSLMDREERITTMLSELEQAQRQVLDSIECASAIQGRMQTSFRIVREYVSDGFVLWWPRDVVGGDSYWFKATPNGYFIGVFDCTGHGVPGAFITLIAHSLLDAMDVEEMEGHPGRTLRELNRSLKVFLGQDDEAAPAGDYRSNDGLEMGLCHYCRASGRLRFSGAGISLFIRDGHGSKIFKASRAGVGYLEVPIDFEYPEIDVPAEREIRCYLSTDGLFDQAGGEKGMPFGKTRFGLWIDAQDGTTMTAQRDSLADLFEGYRIDQPRRDDVTVLGFVP